MSKRPAASVHLHLLSLGDVEVLCKGRKPAAMSVMQYACKAELKCTYLNPIYTPQLVKSLRFCCSFADDSAADDHLCQATSSLLLYF